MKNITILLYTCVYFFKLFYMRKTDLIHTIYNMISLASFIADDWSTELNSLFILYSQIFNYKVG